VIPTFLRFRAVQSELLERVAEVRGQLLPSAFRSPGQLASLADAPPVEFQADLFVVGTHWVASSLRSFLIVPSVYQTTFDIVNHFMHDFSTFFYPSAKSLLTG
jgi:hypothetical protein